MKTLLFVDDHPVYRDGLQRLLADAMSDLKVLVAPDPKGALSLLEQCPEIDLCLADQRLASDRGLDLLRVVRSRWPQVATGLLCAELNRTLVAEAKAIGTVACLSKDRDAESLVDALTAIFDGEVVFDEPSLANRVSPALSARRLEILTFASNGQSDKQIADKLGVSESAIRNHWENIFDRLRAANRTEAVTKALRQGII